MKFFKTSYSLIIILTLQIGIIKMKRRKIKFYLVFLDFSGKNNFFTKKLHMNFLFF